MNRQSIKRKFKFWGKFFTYLSMVGATVSLLKDADIGLSFFFLFMIFIGCAMHEYSE